MDVFDHKIAVPTVSTPFYLVPLGCIHADADGPARAIHVNGVIA